LGQDEADADGADTQDDNYNEQHPLQPPPPPQQQQQRTARCASSLIEKDMQQLAGDQVRR
jgi:hypothetical protein